METKKAKKVDDWIKVQSKSRPGRYYMFNKATGETQWIPLEDQTKDASCSSTTSPSRKKKTVESPPSEISAPKPLKTPAQDRLKRLQHNIKLDRDKKQRRSAPELESKSRRQNDSKEQQENVSRDKPSSSSTPTKGAQKPAHSSPKKSRISSRASKRPHRPSADEEVTKQASEAQATPSPIKNARLTESEENDSASLAVTPHKPIDEDYEMTPCDSVTPISSAATTNVAEVNSKNSTTFSNIGNGIVNKIKDFCRLPFRNYKSREEKKCITGSSSLRDKTTCKQHKKTEPKLEGVSTAIQMALNELREKQKEIVKQNLDKSTDNSASSHNNSLPPPSTPTNLNIPIYQKGSANSRLDRLRKSLLLQQEAGTSVATKLPAPTAVSATNSPRLLPTAAVLNNSTTSIFHTANNTIIDDETEAMDWQPVAKEEPIEISSNESSLSLLPTTEKATVIKAPIGKKEPETMGDIYDAVNENLLRLLAEKKSSSTKNNNKWQKDFYYFVVDTNVLLEHLTFIEDLTKLKLCDTQGSMLYIPYSVLQELDKLKMRSGCQEGVKTLAVRAIKYLNKKFENKSQHLLAQTALEERDHFIDVNSADDSIINCCLQVKTHVPNILLLTEDVNLRNKAICNNILVSTKSDLVSKRYDAAANSDGNRSS